MHHNYLIVVLLYFFGFLCVHDACLVTGMEGLYFQNWFMSPSSVRISIKLFHSLQILREGPVCVEIVYCRTSFLDCFISGTDCLGCWLFCLFDEFSLYQALVAIIFELVKLNQILIIQLRILCYRLTSLQARLCLPKVLSSLYLFSFCCSEDTLNYLDCFSQPKCYLNKMKMNLHQGKTLFYRPFQVRYSFNHLKSSLRSSSCLHERQVGGICFLFDINNYYFAIILHFEICFNYLKYC